MAILALSREYGSGGLDIGRTVAGVMNYEFVDREALLSDARKVGHEWEKWGKGLDEHCPTVWERYDWSFRGFGAIVQHAILQHALDDRVVIMGRGANLILGGVPHACRALIVAPTEVKIARLMERDNTPAEAARILAERTDWERECFVYSIYGKKWNDPDEFDVILSTGEQDSEQIVSILCAVLGEREKLNTESARHMLAMKTLAAKIKADIYTNPAVYAPTLDALFDGKNVVVRGVVRNLKELKRIEELVRESAGKAEVLLDLHFRG